MRGNAAKTVLGDYLPASFDTGADYQRALPDALRGGVQPPKPGGLAPWLQEPNLDYSPPGYTAPTGGAAPMSSEPFKWPALDPGRHVAKPAPPTAAPSSTGLWYHQTKGFAKAGGEGYEPVEEGINPLTKKPYGFAEMLGFNLPIGAQSSGLHGTGGGGGDWGPGGAGDGGSGE